MERKGVLLKRKGVLLKRKGKQKAKRYTNMYRLKE
jgi:hypothetical protein